MKSLLISGRYFPPQTGGISSMMASIARHLGEERACVLTGVSRDGRGAVDIDERVPVYRRRLPFAEGRIRQAAGVGLAVAEVLARERPAALQAATIHDAYLCAKLRPLVRLPYLVYAHGSEILALRDGGAWEGHYRALRDADRVVANSGYTAGLARDAGVPADRIRVLHPGCDGEKFAPLPPGEEDRRQAGLAPGEGPVLLSVGTLVRRKGHDTVIRSLGRLRSDFPRITYVIVGSGEEKGRLEELAASEGVRDRVRFAGRVPDRQLPALYNLADVFVMVSRTLPDASDVEGFGLVYLEANACEVPVVAGDTGGVSDAVVDGVTGLLVDPTDAGEIAAGIARLLDDRDLAKRMGRAGRRRVVEDFRWGDVAERIHEIVASMR